MNEKQDSDILRLAKGTGVSFFGSVAGRLLLFLSQVIIARFFGARAFGLYILGLAAIKIAELIARLGLDIGAMRFVSIAQRNSPEKVKGTLISAVTICFISGVLVAIAVILSAGFVSVRIFHEPELKYIIEIFSFCIPFMTAMMVIATAIQGFQTTKYSVYIRDLIQPITNITLIVILFNLNFGLKGVIYAFVLSHILALISSIYIMTSRYASYFKSGIKAVYNAQGLVSYSAPIFASSLLMFLVLSNTSK